MSQRRQKLELRWVGKDRVLLGLDADGKPLWGDWSDIDPRPLWQLDQIGDPKAENLLIKGDNLYALKALERDFAGKIKCIFIDPPYNTGSAFTHYDDAIEHSLWLSLVRDRLELLRQLLRPDGSIWITIDDSEGHYLKVLLDEIFGRVNSLGTVTWQKTTSIHNNAVLFSSATDMLLGYAKNVSQFKMGRVPRSERNASDYSNPDKDRRGAWASSPLHVSLTSGQRGKQYAATGKSSGLFPIKSPHGKKIWPPKGRCWGYSLETIQKFQKEKLIWWGSHGRNQPRLKRYLKDNQEGVVPTTLWLSEEVGHNQEAKAENSVLLPDVKELFSTPKPERLLQRIFQLSTKPGDWVLDSFAGSGTTGAVAHKMGRRWIMVESGEHCHTHTIPRLKKVIDGADPGGVTKTVGWKGGGGFRYCVLGEPLLTKDPDLGVIVNPNYENGRLVEAVCKFEGFKLNNDETFHGVDGKRFAHITEDQVTQEYLDALTEQLGENESLYIYCTRRAMRLNTPDNVRIKRMPKDLLKDRPDLFKHGQS